MLERRWRAVCPALWTWLVLALPAVPARANTVLLTGPPGQGTEIIQPLGFPPQLSPALGPVFFDVSGSAVAAMVFDLSFIPKGTSITSATFTMSVGGSTFIRSPSSPSLIISDYVGLGPTVSLSDFNQGTSSLGSIDLLPPMASPGSLNVVKSFDVSSFVQSLVNNGTPDAGFQFQGSLGAVYIPGNSTRPSLSITSPVTLVVPEPRSALLLAVGMAGMLAACLYHAILGGKNAAISSL
jgi:hypothetical protein